jgi:2-phosphosulfolactate phosphatase
MTIETHFTGGMEGLKRFGRDANAVVVVDVLSFTTTVDVAVANGTVILPYALGKAGAKQYAREKNADLAVHRTRAGPDNPYSLSPASFENSKGGARVVLPSPNGSSLSLVASELCPVVYAACLRNFESVASRLSEGTGSVLVVAAGEKWDWSTGPLRPAFEDLIGAGALLGALTTKDASPGAIAAAGAYREVESRIKESLRKCQSGRELIEMGFGQDVEFASDANSSHATPRLLKGEYVNEDFTVWDASNDALDSGIQEFGD